MFDFVLSDSTSLRCQGRSFTDDQAALILRCDRSQCQRQGRRLFVSHRTPLQLAVERNDKEMVSILLAHRFIRPLERNRRMESVVQIATQFHFYDLANMIKEKVRSMPTRPVQTACGIRPRSDTAARNRQPQRPQTAIVRIRTSVATRLFSPDGQRPKLAQPPGAVESLAKLPMKELTKSRPNAPHWKRSGQRSTRRKKESVSFRSRLNGFPRADSPLVE